VALICVTSGAFIVSGDYLGSKIADATGINYLEVRPSNLATLEVAKSVYRENAFTGVGPNRFEDAWRLYKDPVINETQFWATNFVSGNSYALTVLSTTGILGAVSFIAFLCMFLLLGYRTVFADRKHERSWGLIGTVAFTAAAYLWLMTFWYTPGPTVLLLAAFFTGLMIAVRESEKLVQPPVIDVARSRQYGFLLIASSLVSIVVATSAIVTIVDRYQAEMQLVKAANVFAQTADSAAFDVALEEVSRSMPDQDVYVAERARLRLAELNRLTTLTEPTDEDRQRFEALIVEGVRLSESAIALDRTNAFNYALLASFYGLLNPSQFEGIAERRDGALALATQYDPKNPEYKLLAGQTFLRFGDTVRAREELTAALALKSNYTDALFLLSQIDIEEGNAASAIATTRSIITIEPFNPGRRYQLGLLLLATGELEEAAQAFEDAVVLDPNYANARYMLALTYIDLGVPEQALEQLRIVAVTNPDNTSLSTLIQQIESGVTDLNVSPSPIVESPTVEENEQTVTSNPPDTDLVTPVNRVPQPEVEGEENVEGAGTGS
jgi:tetratricopeptide (TPR) repeat protein